MTVWQYFELLVHGLFAAVMLWLSRMTSAIYIFSFATDLSGHSGTTSRRRETFASEWFVDVGVGGLVGMRLGLDRGLQVTVYPLLPPGNSTFCCANVPTAVVLQSTETGIGGRISNVSKLKLKLKYECKTDTVTPNETGRWKLESKMESFSCIIDKEQFSYSSRFVSTQTVILDGRTRSLPEIGKRN